MAVFKCKMCGGELEFEAGATICECAYCGSRQTLPRLDDDRRANLYDRANHFRRNNEFDKAASIYEQILNEDGTDAEAYWSLVLCRYGIEYVEDPATHKRIPTVNRAQFTSIFDDDNYKSALRYADGYQRAIYEEEANTINEIQKGILAISQREEPFDVFICYKETDNNGRRTPDSVLANDLYHQLTQEGFKVFFSRITLEDKLGTAYEPYIFAALNSAKVMVVLGTRAEYFNAVWVKNEWSRYLALVKKSNGKKVLIPAYRDMDPYDLPEEFSHLQAQDMSRLGFMQDLIRGIKKIVGAAAPQAVKETVVMNAGNTNTAPLVKRAFIFLEDGNWQEADEYCEKVLDLDPECAEAYLGKLMAELRVHRQEELADCKEPFDGMGNYQKAVRFADDNLAATLRGYIARITERNEHDRLASIYNGAVEAMQQARTEADYKAVAEAFGRVAGFEDADILAQQCVEKAEESRKDAIYRSAKSRMEDGGEECLASAARLFKSIPGWKDSDALAATCFAKVEENLLAAKRREEQERIAAERRKAHNKKLAMIITPIVCVALVIVLATMIVPKQKKYNKAVEKFGQEFVDTFYALGVGDTFTFGTYEQDLDKANGEEDIEWLVLAKKEKRILVISKYALDCWKYNSSDASVTWETCSLRKWLNDTFLNSAFNEEEQSIIPMVSVSADENPSYSTDSGKSTKDRVFLLSIAEVNKYLDSDSARRCRGTAYCYARGASKGDNGSCKWWLRSPGYNSNYAACIFSSGLVNSSGVKVSRDNCAVRPALWIDLG